MTRVIVEQDRGAQAEHCWAFAGINDTDTSSSMRTTTFGRVEALGMQSAKLHKLSSQRLQAQRIKRPAGAEWAAQKEVHFLPVCRQNKFYAELHDVFCCHCLQYV